MPYMSGNLRFPSHPILKFSKFSRTDDFKIRSIFLAKFDAVAMILCVSCLMTLFGIRPIILHREYQLNSIQIFCNRDIYIYFKILFSILPTFHLEKWGISPDRRSAEKGESEFSGRFRSLDILMTKEKISGFLIYIFF